jgi:guanylate kinase
MKPGKPLIGVVGPCGAGKSTLIAGLERHGYTCRHIAQEHSYVPDMWQRLSHPDLLIFLNASYETTIRRRSLNWSEEEYQEQQRRLAHARAHADLIIETDTLSIEEVLQTALRFLAGKGDRGPQTADGKDDGEPSTNGGTNKRIWAADRGIDADGRWTVETAGRA